MLPAFVLVGRLDVAETVGQVLAEVAGGRCGVRPSAARMGVPYTTARGWWRRFASGATRWAVAFAALAVELGEAAVRPLSSSAGWALAGIGAAWRAAAGLPGWAQVGLWRFISTVTGGKLIATNTDSLWLIVGSRRFMPPTP